MLYWVCAGVYTPFLSAYFTRLGFDASQVGMLLAVQPLCALAVQPLWSLLADRLGRRKQVLVSLCALAAGVSLLYYVGQSFVSVLLITLCFAIFFQALLPLCDSLVIEASERAGLEFSRVRMGGTIGYAVVVAVVGYVLEAVPALQFVIVASALVLFAVQASRLPQPWHEATAGRQTAARQAAAAERSDEAPAAGARAPARVPGRGILAIFDTTDIVYVLAFAFVDFLGLGFLGTFLGSWCVEIGRGQDLVGILSAVSAMSEVPILLVSSKLVQRFGEIRLLAFSCLAMAVRLLLVGSGVVPVMIAGQLLQSVSYMTVYFSCVTFISRHTYPSTRARGQSVLAMVQSGLAMVVANLAGGAISDALGMAAAFRIAAVVMVVGFAAALAFMLATRRPAQAEGGGRALGA